jgi:amidophosphoribosyltransferase
MQTSMVRNRTRVPDISRVRDMSQDRVSEACGVFGIYARDEDVARIAFFSLYALQHRGQESAGIAVTDGDTIKMHKAMGLVSQVFTEENLAPLQGFIAVGHTRYATTGSSIECNASPILAQSDLGPFVTSHNGNLVNYDQIRESLVARSIYMNSTTDSEAIAAIIAHSKGATWEAKLSAALDQIFGAYSLIIMTTDRLFGIRDNLGIRPLCIGKLNHGWVLSSETCALATINATFVREVEPGETVAIDSEGVHSVERRPQAPAFCIFEHIYLARPDSEFDGRLIYEARLEMGRQLARQYPIDADLVLGIPDSATAAAIGYAEESGIPYMEGLIKNRYIGRTFIQPGQRLRQAGISLKFNPLPELLEGKRVVVVDDSIVRGNTTKATVEMLRQAGAKEIHLRICCPPMRHPCFLGVDTATYEELIAHRMSVEEIQEFIGADSLGYLSLDRLIQATGRPPQAFCVGCFNADYPPQILQTADDWVREKIGAGAEEERVD